MEEIPGIAPAGATITEEPPMDNDAPSFKEDQPRSSVAPQTQHPSRTPLIVEDDATEEEVFSRFSSC